MRRALGTLLSVAVLGGLLVAVTWLTSPPSEEVAAFDVQRPEAAEALPALARFVRYSPTFEVAHTSRLSVDLEGRGEVLLSLVSEDGGVREVAVDAPGRASFASVEAGRWSLRAVAPPGVGGAVSLRASLGGVSARLVGATLLVLLVPVMWPYRRAPRAALKRLGAVDPVTRGS
ncbi:MAG: hypothetical protein AAF411_27570 [Myxococcota bacterium]